MWPRNARTLITYREAALWYLLVGTAVTIMAASGSDQGHPLPVVPRSLPTEREVHPPPTVAAPPPETRPPPTTTPTRPTTTTTEPPTRPGQVGEPQGSPAQEPPPPTSVPPTTSPPTTTTTTTTAPT